MSCYDLSLSNFVILTKRLCLGEIGIMYSGANPFVHARLCFPAVIQVNYSHCLNIFTRTLFGSMIKFCRVITVTFSNSIAELSSLGYLQQLAFVIIAYLIFSQKHVYFRRPSNLNFVWRYKQLCHLMSCYVTRFSSNYNLSCTVYTGFLMMVNVKL